MLGIVRRYGPDGCGPRKRDIQGVVFQVRAIVTTEWNYSSPYSEVMMFGVVQAGKTPVGSLIPLRAVEWDQPLSQWTVSDPDGDEQDAYILQIATDPGFGTIVFDSGTVESKVRSYQHSGLTPDTYYRRLKVRTNGTDWSEYDQDSFTIAPATSQSALWELFRKHPDGVLSKIYIPISSVVASQCWNDTTNFEFVINNFAPFVERNWVALHHFDEMSGEVAHDIFGANDLALTGSPAWTDGVLNLTGTEYGVCEGIPLDISGDWTGYVVASTDGTTGTLWYLGAYADTSNFAEIKLVSAGVFRLSIGGTNSNVLNCSDVDWVVLCAKKVGTDYTLTRLDTGASVTNSGAISGTARLALGKRMHSSPTNVIDSARIAGHLLYSDDMTSVEDTRQLKAFRSSLVHRGIEL